MLFVFVSTLLLYSYSAHKRRILKFPDYPTRSKGDMVRYDKFRYCKWVG